MPLTGSFGDLKFNLIEGYRIAIMFTPGEGIQQNFFVYVWERLDARNAFPSQVNLGTEGVAPQETLILEDDVRTYTFKKIDLAYAEFGVNRRERFRLLEFHYDSEILNHQEVPAELKNKDTTPLHAGNLKDEYTFSLEGSKEQLLGFRARLSALDSCVYRFSAYRNNQNSFVEKLIQVHDKSVPTRQKMPEFTINFAKGDLKVTRENLLRAYAEESYGHLRSFRPLSLSEVVRGGGDSERTRVALWSTRPSSLLVYDSESTFRTPNQRGDAVETGTFVFQRGEHRNPPLT